MNEANISQAKSLLLIACLAFALSVSYYAVAILHGNEGTPALPNLDVLESLVPPPTTDGQWIGKRPSPAISCPAVRLSVFIANLPISEASRFDLLYLTHGFLAVLYAVLLFKLARTWDPSVATLATVLALLKAHTVFAYMQLTKTSLFLPAATAALFCAFQDRAILTCIFLILAGWISPESAILAGTLALGTLFQRTMYWRDRWRWFFAGAVAFAVPVLFLDAGAPYWPWRYPSVPGVFERYSQWVSNLAATAKNFLWCGWQKRPPYHAMLPAVEPLLALAALSTVDWQKIFPGIPIRALGMGVLLMVTACGIAGNTMSNGPIIWGHSLWTLLAIVGANRIAGLLPRPRLALRTLAAVLVTCAAATLPSHLREFSRRCHDTQSAMDYMRHVDTSLPPKLSVGTLKPIGLRYLMPSHPCIVLPDISHAELIEQLKYESSLRFDYWIAAASDSSLRIVQATTDPSDTSISESLPFNSSWTVKRACWAPLDRARFPLSPAIVASVHTARLVATLDVGYTPHELRHEYKTSSRIAGFEPKPVALLRTIEDLPVLDTSRLILGSDGFRVTVRPYQPVSVVLRTASMITVELSSWGTRYANESFAFQNNIRLIVRVNENKLETQSIELDPAPDRFSEAIIRIPSEFVTTDALEIELIGDHVACCYWVYQ